MKQPSVPHKSWDAPRLSKVDGEGRLLFACSGARIARVNEYGTEFKLDDDFETCIELWADYSITQENSSWRAREVTDEFNQAFFELFVGITLQRMTYEMGHSAFLHLDFENGVHIQCPAAPEGFQYEAWNVQDPNGFHAVCAIGGRVSAWPPTLWQTRIAERKRKEQTSD